MTGPDANTQDTRSAVTTHPLLGIAGVRFGALIAASTGSLMSVGLAGSRGALHLAVEVLGLQDRQQAHTLAISDTFRLLATCCVVCLVVVSFMFKVPTQYRRVTAAPMGAK